MKRKAWNLLASLIIAIAIFAAGYSLAWNRQETRRLECGQGWYETLELVDALIERTE
jgi:hypothetical protein